MGLPLRLYTPPAARSKRAATKLAAELQGHIKSNMESMAEGSVGINETLSFSLAKMTS